MQSLLNRGMSWVFPGGWFTRLQTPNLLPQERGAFSHVLFASHLWLILPHPTRAPLFCSKLTR